MSPEAANLIEILAAAAVVSDGRRNREGEQREKRRNGVWSMEFGGGIWGSKEVGRREGTREMEKSPLST